MVVATAGTMVPHGEDASRSGAVEIGANHECQPTQHRQALAPPCHHPAARSPLCQPARLPGKVIIVVYKPFALLAKDKKTKMLAGMRNNA